MGVIWLKINIVVHEEQFRFFVHSMETSFNNFGCIWKAGVIFEDFLFTLL